MARQTPRFTPWIEWSKRSALRGMGEHGLYVLAKFRKPATGHAQPTDKRVIYIGATSRSKIGKRLREFHHAAFDGRGENPEGRIYRRAYHDKGEGLYVAIAPMKGLAPEKRAVYLRYLESKLIWAFARRHGGAPRCNRG